MKTILIILCLLIAINLNIRPVASEANQKYPLLDINLLYSLVPIAIATIATPQKRRVAIGTLAIALSLTTRWLTYNILTY